MRKVVRGRVWSVRVAVGLRLTPSLVFFSERRERGLSWMASETFSALREFWNVLVHYSPVN